MNKYECCYECFIKFVEGREELWQERKKEMTDGSSIVTGKQIGRAHV